MAQLDIQLFGFPTLTLAGEAVVVDTRKALALVAYLALAGQPVSRDALATLLWPDFDQERSRAALRRTLFALRAGLDGFGLETGRQALALDPDADMRVDVLEFRRLLALADSHHPPGDAGCRQCLEWREAAVALYTDDLLAGFTLRDSAAFDDWQLQESENLRVTLGRALEKLVAGRMRQGPGAFPQAIASARRWLQLDPLREEAHQQLMQLYAWSGRRADAVRQYRDCLRTLEQELGVQPLAETTALYHAIMEDRLPPPDIGEVTEAPVMATQAGLIAGNVNGGAPFVGRAAEMAQLDERYRQVNDSGYLLALIGEAGVGKTRLAEMFIHTVPGQVIIGRCYENEAQLAFGCFGQAIRDALGRPGAGERLAAVAPHWLAEAARLIPEVSAQTPALPAAPPMSGPGAQSRFMEGLLQVIMALCEGRRPGVLFLDDVQWADEASLDLLTYLAHRLHRRSLLVLLTWRDESNAREQRLRQLLAEGERAGRAGRIMLARLGPVEVDELVAAARVPRIAGLSSRLYEETEGLPYFLVEYLAALAQGEDAPDWSMPRGVRDLLQVRLAQPGETARQLLQAAAVIGREFTYDLVHAAGGRSDEETVSGLEELTAQKLVSEMPARSSVAGRPGGEPRYDFRHHKVREVVYEDMNLARRRILHHRVAEALAGSARRAPQPDAFAGQIAQHYLLGGDEQQAAEYSRLAGAHAASLYANREALAHFQTALALGHPDGAFLHEACGDLYTRLGEYGPALENYEAALATAAGERAARLEHRIGLVHQRRGEWEAAESFLAAAWNGLGDDSVHRAELLADWSRNAYRQGDFQRALELAERAQHCAEEAGSQEAQAQIQNIMGMLARRNGDIPAALAHLHRGLELAEGATDPSARVAALNNLALLYAEEGRPGEGLLLLESALAQCRLVGDRHREAALLNNMADLLHATGRSDEALTRLTESVAIYNEIGRERGEWQPEIWKLTEW